MADPTHEELLAAHRTQEDTVRVVRSAIDAFNAGDTEAFLSNFTDDMHFKMNGSHGFSTPCRSKAEFVELVGRVAADLSEMITLEILSFHPAGEWAVTETQGTAKMTDGTPYQNVYCMLWHVKGGKIVEFKEHNDSALVEKTFFS